MRLTRQGIKPPDRINFVVKKLKPNAFLIGASWIDFHDVASNAEPAACETDVVAFVQHIDQTTQHRLARDVLTAFDREQHVKVILWRSDAVDAGNAGDDDRVAA